MSRDHTLNIDKEFADEVVKLRDDDGKKWDEIREITGIATGKCMLAYSWAKVPKGERIKAATAADVVRLRDEKVLSWGDISVRTGINENACRSMYTEATKRDTKGLRIGKGGRHPGGTTGEPKAKSTKAAKPAAAVHDLFADMDNDEVKTALTGYAIKVDLGEGVVAVKVKAVKTVNVAKNRAVITDAETGESRTIKLSAVSVISRKKIAA